jgi:hypothetical protein
VVDGHSHKVRRRWTSEPPDRLNALPASVIPIPLTASAMPRRDSHPTEEDSPATARTAPTTTTTIPAANTGYRSRHLWRGDSRPDAQLRITAAPFESAASGVTYRSAAVLRRGPPVIDITRSEGAPKSVSCAHLVVLPQARER